jgi:hypothetical protein
MNIPDKMIITQTEYHKNWLVCFYKDYFFIFYRNNIFDNFYFSKSLKENKELNTFEEVIPHNNHYLIFNEALDLFNYYQKNTYPKHDSQNKKYKLDREYTDNKKIKF